MLHDTPENPIVLFDRITGYPPGYRVLTNHQSSIRKLALIEGVAPDLPPMEILRALKERRKEIYPIPPRQVADGPVFENCDRGDEVNLLKFPVPRWRALDAGRYIGTGTAVINRDPEGDWVNVGTYRQQVHDERTVGMYIEHAHHGRIIAAKYWADGKACPVVVCYGQEVELFRASAGSSPWGRSELDVAGGLKGEPIDVVKGPLTGLPIPARAEIAVEGEIPPPSVEARTEGPFREWPGYYTQAAVPQPVLHVRAVYHRNDPIMTGPLGNDRNVLVDGTHHAAIAVWEALERTALPGVQGVWDHCNGLFIVISIQQQFAGHAKMALLTATSARGSGSAWWTTTSIRPTSPTCCGP
jgi:4-hydroxy-3-polyprenylbenzoate decarboxylase